MEGVTLWASPIQSIMQNIRSNSKINLKYRTGHDSQRESFPGRLPQDPISSPPQTKRQFGCNLSNSNFREVLLPSSGQGLPLSIAVRTCLLLPGSPSHQRLRLSPQQRFTHKSSRYHSAHESDRLTHRSLAPSLSNAATLKSFRTSRKMVAVSHRSLRSQQNIPRLKKHWNYGHNYQLNQAESHKANQTNKFPPSLAREKQKSTRAGCIQLDMQCIPFAIWNRVAPKYFHRGNKIQCDSLPTAHNQAQNSRNSNPDLRKRIQLLTREENLRKKLLFDLFCSRLGNQAQRPFISYFPHTDYDLALKAYLSRQEERGERSRLYSVSHRREEEEQREPVLFRRESCLAFTEFNREKYDIKMTRAELIQKIISSKASEQITGSLLREIKEKIGALMHPLYPSAPPAQAPDIVPIHEGLDESDDSCGELINIEHNFRVQNTSTFVQHHHDFRVSSIAPIEVNQCESEHKILAELIEEIDTKAPQPSVKLSSRVRTVSKDITVSSQSQGNITLSREPMPSPGKHAAVKVSRFQPRSTFKDSSSIQRVPVRQQARLVSDSLYMGKHKPSRKEHELKKVKKESISKKVSASLAPQEEENIVRRASRQGSTIATPAHRQHISRSSQQPIASQDFKACDEEEPREVERHLIQPNIFDIGQDYFETFPQAAYRTADCLEIIAKLEISCKILSNAAQGFSEQIIRNKVYFLNGKWMKVDRGAGIEGYARGVCELGREGLKVEEGGISLELVLKMMTGQRVIVFKRKPALEKEVLYHHSKGHRLYLLHKRNHKLFTLHKLHSSPDQPTEYEIQSIDTNPESIVCSFETILDNCQLISLNHRVSSQKQHRACIDCEIVDAESQVITLYASESTSGTITAYFPGYRGTLYVQVVMQKLLEKGVKSMGRVYERLRYDNIYFQFSIKGEYQLRIRLEEQINMQCTIAYEGSHPVQFNLKDNE